jgi:4-amino-4-deoxychorismate lyase
MKRMTAGTLIIVTRPTVGATASAGEGFRVADIDEPQLSVLDLAATRGDGVFETIGVSDGHPQAVSGHLARFARSAAMLDLPEPDLSVWAAAVTSAVETHPPAPELSAKLVLSRGIEGANSPTAWIYVETVGDLGALRGTGIAVVTLDRGYRHDVATTSPWLLQGAKTLSYAANRAALREAERRGADDVVFVSSDGVLLEGPTSNLLLRVGDRVITPATDQGILAGTTQASAFAFFESAGLQTAYETVPASALETADAAWLLSSVRLAAPIHTADGRPMAVDAELTSRLNAFLLARDE